MVQPEIKLGVIKGGQLGYMLSQAPAAQGVEFSVMDNDPDCPCRSASDHFVVGDSLNFDDVYAFGKTADVITLEYEHVNVEALKWLMSQGVKVRPSPSVIEIVQDKGKQKEFYRNNGIPTADFVLTTHRGDVDTHKHFLPAVQKTRQAGYDGKGIRKIASAEDIGRAFDEPSVLERWVDFDKEIAVLAARDINGKVVVYPTVEMMFHPEQNLVEFLLCPARLPASIEQVAKDIALKLIEALAVVGVLAVEMFVTKDGKVLVNEMAPRVHNSGHHTIEANQTSQFEQHLRAVLGLPLGSPEMVMPSVMVNILGEPGFEGKVRYEGLQEAEALMGVHIHLYGKQITRPFRKMGHATILDHDLDAALAKARRVKEIIKVRT